MSWSAFTVIALLLGANVLAVTGARLPLLSPAVGFWFILLYPVYLLYTTSFWPTRTAPERLGYSLAAVLLLLIILGLAINTVLPSLGIQRPLAPVNVALLGDGIDLSLLLFRRRHRGSFPWRAMIRASTPQETRFIGASILCIVLAILGANRLNNAAGPLVSIIALVGMAFLVALLLRLQSQFREGIVAACLYFLSLALLLMTSLRGWYITGHDIQTEYRTFQLVVAHGRWDFSLFRNAYNGCLSITVLPTEIAGVTNFDDAYVYKVLFQIIFALVPVLVYTISRRYWSRPVSILAAIYFISLPNFFTDMPYENRQEIAFVFVCAAMLSITNSGWRQSRRRGALLAATLGVELCHYSTMYLFIGATAAAWVFGSLLQLFRWRRSKSDAFSLVRPWAGATRTVGIGTLAVMAVMISVWGGLATHTAGRSLHTVATSISQLFTAGSETSLQYSIFSRTTANPSALLTHYRDQALAVNRGSAPGTYIPAEVAQTYPTPVVAEPVVPATRLGQLLTRVGVSVAGLNTTVRQSAAKDEQLFLAVGLAAIILTAGLRRRVPREFFCLCLGSAFVVGLFVVFPNLSTDYGLLRAFQETLIVVAPVLVQGSLTVFAPFGNKWRLKLSCAVAVVIFISTTGLMPQLLGDYPAQLSLNNSGIYYDEYYLHPQEVAAVAWLANKPGVIPDGLQASPLFAFTSPSDVTGEQVVRNFYPALLNQSSWVLFDYAIVHYNRATINIGNNTISYAYPSEMLRSNKNLVYNNGSAEIYK